MNETQGETWLSLTQAANWLGVSRRTLNFLIEDNEVPVLRLKRNIRIEMNELRKLKEGRIGPRS